MKSVKERINDLPEDTAKKLAKALDSFKCDDLPCSACPLCDEDGVCLFILVDDHAKGYDF